MASARVAIERAEELLALSAADPDALGAVLRTAWAVLLRCYTGQDDVIFSFQRGGDGAAAEPAVVRFCLDDGASIARLVGRAKTELAGRPGPAAPPELLRSGDPDDRPLFDTAVVLWTFSQTSAPCPVLSPVLSVPLRLAPWVNPLTLHHNTHSFRPLFEYHCYKQP
jgi:hypothetical protein